MNPPDPWFCSATDNSAGAQLFCFPYAGGNASAFLPWRALLDSQLDLHVAQLPGRGARLFEPLANDFDALIVELARAVAARANEDFAFFGHSLGAYMAFEVSRRLRAAGEPGPTSLWVSGADGPQTRAVPRPVHKLPDRELIDVLRDYNGTPAELLDDAEMMQLLLPSIRADFALAASYTYRAEPPLDVPVHVLSGDRDRLTTPVGAAGWSRETRLPLRQHRYPGDHFFIFTHAQAITTSMLAELSDDPAEQHH